MSNSVGSQFLTGTFKVVDGATKTLADQSVVGYSSIAFSILSSQAVMMEIYAGRQNTGREVKIIEKTLPAGSLYYRKIDTVADFIFVRFINSTGSDSRIQLETTLSYTSQPNSLARQHLEIDKTNTVSVSRDCTTFDHDLVRGFLQSQSDPEVEGISGTVSTTSRTLWIDSGTSSVDDSVTLGAVVSILSTSAADALAGTGAQKVRVIGLDADSKLLEEEVEMAGIGGVTTNGSFLRVNKLEVTQAGGGLFNVGDITAEISGSVLEKINAEDSISKTAHFTVPVDHDLLMDGIHLNSNVADTVSLYVYETEMTSATDGTVKSKKLVKEVPAVTGSHYIHLRRKVSSLTTISCEIQSTALPLGTNSISARFDGVLIDTTF